MKGLKVLVLERLVAYKLSIMVNSCISKSIMGFMMVKKLTNIEKCELFNSNVFDANVHNKRLLYCFSFIMKILRMKGKNMPNFGHSVY